MRGLDELRATVVDDRYKGIPLGTRLRLDEVGAQGWNVAAGDLSLPTTTLSASALSHNLATMAQYCEQHGAVLAPHGKTTMAPQLFHAQLEHGAIAVTAATSAQAATMRRFGVPRVIVANELVEPGVIRWAADEMAADETCEIISLVDDPATVQTLESVLAEHAAPRALPVLIEVGVPNGRAGVRTLADALAVARAVAAAGHLRLVGIETYEGLAASGASPEELAAVDTLLALVREVVDTVEREGLFETDTVMVTAGGSSFFDRVVADLRWPEGSNKQLVLRSGCYLSHDLGKYHHLSPLDGRREPGESLELHNALLGWGAVLSRPQPDLVIVGAGKRDLPYDLSLPTALHAYRPGRADPVALADVATTTKMMDQHLFLTVPESLDLQPGDLVSFALSHPCTAFDKMRLLPVVDDDLTVVDAVLTFF